MTLKQFFILCILCSLCACKKAGERQCLKGFGEDTVVTLPLDSVYEFKLYKNIRYEVYQDTLRKLVIRGGANMVNFIEVNNLNYVLSVRNQNKCDFLRKYEQKIIVEIHYPHFRNFYSETEDSLIFHDTLRGHEIHIEQNMGGGGVRLHVDTDILVLSASHGVASYQVSGTTTYADLRLQTGSSGNAENLRAKKLVIDHNSTGNLLVNLDSASAAITIRGTGNVLYRGNPDSLSVIKSGDGALIQH